MANKWLNNDGLLIEFGTQLGVPGKAGTYQMDSGIHVLEFKDIALTSLVDDPTTLVDGVAQGILDLHNVIPTGVTIEKVETISTVLATSGGSAVLDVGVVDKDFAGNDDDDALIAAEPVASYAAAGNIVTFTQGSTRHGVAVGEITTKPLYVTASYDTAAFTAGVVTIRIYYSF
jgi:hypothetical protein